jgi:hypothetical protein
LTCIKASRETRHDALINGHWWRQSIPSSCTGCGSVTRSTAAGARTFATNIARLERFFRTSGGLDIDKADVKRYEGFVHAKVYDLLLRGVAGAKANGRDVIRPHDLPITKGLQESMHEFRKLDHELDLKPILEHLASRPQLELNYDDETQALLPHVAGGLSVALARCFKIIYPSLRNPQTQHWQAMAAVFDRLV